MVGNDRHRRQSRHNADRNQEHIAAKPRGEGIDLPPPSHEECYDKKQEPPPGADPVHRGHQLVERRNVFDAID